MASASQAWTKQSPAKEATKTTMLHREDLDSDSSAFKAAAASLNSGSKKTRNAETPQEIQNCDYSALQVQSEEELVSLFCEHLKGFSRVENVEVMNGSKKQTLALTISFTNPETGEVQIWGDGGKTKSINKLFNEITAGETVLQVCKAEHSCKHKMVRRTQVAKMNIEHGTSGTDRKLLVETHQDRSGNGDFMRRYVTPSEKILGGEDPWTGCVRGCKEEFSGMDTSKIEMVEDGPDKKVLVVEAGMSSSYPGILCVYMLYFFPVRLSGLPKTTFFTSEGPNSEHRWEWFSESDYYALDSVGSKVKKELDTREPTHKSAAKRELCFMCAKVVTLHDKLMKEGNTWCMECYNRSESCGACRAPISRPYVTLNGKKYHQACHNAIGNACNVCQQVVADIESDAVTAYGRRWHSKCFRCCGCGKKLGELTIGGQAWGVPMCALCHTEAVCVILNDASQSKSKAFPPAMKLAPATAREGQSCAGCSLPMKEAELVVSLGPSIYHQACTVCSWCNGSMEGCEPIRRGNRVFHASCVHTAFPVSECNICMNAITSQQRATVWEGRKVHFMCLRCNVCGGTLQAGYSLVDSRHVCSTCALDIKSLERLGSDNALPSSPTDVFHHAMKNKTIIEGRRNSSSQSLSDLDYLERLYEMTSRGVLTQEEFQATKRRLLGI